MGKRRTVFNEKFRPLLKNLKFTLDTLLPRISQQMGDENNVKLGLFKDELESLGRQMKEGTRLLVKLSKPISLWNCCIWYNWCNYTELSYMDQLVPLNKSLTILLETLKLLQEARDVKECSLSDDEQDEWERRLLDLLRVQTAGNVQEFSASNEEETKVHGQTVGELFWVMFDTVVEVKHKNNMFKCPLQHIKLTLDFLRPYIGIAELNLPNEDLEFVRIQIEKGVELVRKCNKQARCKKYKYTNKLFELNQYFQGLLDILMMRQARKVRKCHETETVIKRIEESGVVQNQTQIECTKLDQDFQRVLNILRAWLARNVRKQFGDVREGLVSLIKRIEERVVC
ncbi:hypothetical protein PRUPE_5G127800 [Prunus persica]|uniref:RPW8 domain-containing protein n=1 Tax=Prunus persica TaxID=3760 RepID=A0A251P7Q1_PRUPE|nr:hypothetical protein PRUPE_5G127800 [Prunus persica]